jgi:hypothetical protein
MGGIFGDIGEFFTGRKSDAAAKAQSQAGQLAGQVANQGMGMATQGQAGVNNSTNILNQQAAQAGQLAQGYNQGAQQSMGANSAEYMANANKAAQGQAEQEAQSAATGGARQAVMAGRASGLNKGQAALQAGQRAGDTYSGALQGGLNAGRNQYANAAQQFGQMGAQQQGIGMQGAQAAGGLQQGIMNAGASMAGGGASTMSNSAAQQQQAATAGGAAGGSTLAAGMSAVGSIFSDEGMKDNIKPSNLDALVAKVKGAAKTDPLADLVSKVRPVDFNYKPESGIDPSADQVGVLAQDLEKTSMADNVKDTPAGKVVDTDQQTMSNTNLIVQMAQKMFALEAELDKLRGGKK